MKDNDSYRQGVTRCSHHLLEKSHSFWNNLYISCCVILLCAAVGIFSCKFKVCSSTCIHFSLHYDSTKSVCCGEQQILYRFLLMSNLFNLFCSQSLWQPRQELCMSVYIIHIPTEEPILLSYFQIVLLYNVEKPYQ